MGLRLGSRRSLLMEKSSQEPYRPSLFQTTIRAVKGSWCLARKCSKPFVNSPGITIGNSFISKPKPEVIVLFSSCRPQAVTREFPRVPTSRINSLLIETWKLGSHLLFLFQQALGDTNISITFSPRPLTRGKRERTNPAAPIKIIQKRSAAG